MGAKTGIGAALMATGFGLPIGIPLLIQGIQEDTAKKPGKLKPPPAKEGIEAAAAARENERRRLAASSGSRATILSDNKNALSGSIGRRVLGGTS